MAVYTDPPVDYTVTKYTKKKPRNTTHHDTEVQGLRRGMPTPNAHRDGMDLPLYVWMAINDTLPPGWMPTGLTERYKIKVQFGKTWWELPMVQAECVFLQFRYTKTKAAYYAWCWGDERLGSWQPGGPNMKTNISRYIIDAENSENSVQFNIDNGRKRTIKIEDTHDGLKNLENLLARQCKL